MEWPSGRPSRRRTAVGLRPLLSRFQLWHPVPLDLCRSLYESAKAATIKVLRLGGLHKRNLFVPGFEGCASRIKGPAGLVSLLVLQTGTLCCSPTWSFLCVFTSLCPFEFPNFPFLWGHQPVWARCHTNVLTLINLLFEGPLLKHSHILKYLLFRISMYKF